MGDGKLKVVISKNYISIFQNTHLRTTSAKIIHRSKLLKITLATNYDKQNNPLFPLLNQVINTSVH